MGIFLYKNVPVVRGEKLGITANKKGNISRDIVEDLMNREKQQIDRRKLLYKYDNIVSLFEKRRHFLSGNTSKLKLWFW